MQHLDGAPGADGGVGRDDVVDWLAPQGANAMLADEAAPAQQLRRLRPRDLRAERSGIPAAIACSLTLARFLRRRWLLSIACMVSGQR